jgi:hypothetical protein
MRWNKEDPLPALFLVSRVVLVKEKLSVPDTLDAERLLPVWHNGRLEVPRWGNRRGESSRLPCTAWTQTDTVEDGRWGECEVEPVVIPARMGLDKGVWFCISQGIRGLLVHDERGMPRVYVMCEPSSHYYRIMTRGSDWMQVLIGERI